MDIDNSGLCLAPSLELYAAGYAGYTLLRRLMHIALVSPQYRNETLRYFIPLLKQGINTSFYQQLFRELPDAAHAIEPMDTQWVAATDRAAAARLETLEQELNAARSMISKEGIRKAHSNIGDYSYERGNLEDAMKSYYRCRDYCTMPWHLDEMYESVFNVSADLDEFATVGYASQSRTAQGGDAPVRPLGAERKQVSSAMASLRQKDYAGAARALLDLKSFSEAVFPTLISCQDISVYGTVLAVATLSREDLRNISSSGHPFRQYIEFVPCMKSFLDNFLEGRYLNVMETCRLLGQQLQFDIIFSRHLNAVIALIIDKVFLQFVQPYEALDLTKMASGLNMPVDEVVSHLSGLIASDRILAKLDTVSMTLRRTKVNHQEVAVKRVIKVTDENSVNSQRALIRLCMLQNGITGDNQNENDA
jgi:COP9 signalosome complex subunit 1